MSQNPRPYMKHVHRGMVCVVIATLCLVAAPVSGHGQTQVSGRDQGFVPYSEEPIRYLSDRVNDPVARFQDRLDRGEARLEFEPEHGYLKSVLKQLEIPVSSQRLVFSKSSFQYRKISPRTPRTLYEQAALTLGSGRWRTFWSITLPSIRWGVAYGVTLTVARSLGEFGAVLVVSGNVIGRTQTATLYIEEGVESFHPGGAYAASLVLAAISFILLVVMVFIRKHLEGGRENRA